MALTCVTRLQMLLMFGGILNSEVKSRDDEQQTYTMIITWLPVAVDKVAEHIRITCISELKSKCAKNNVLIKPYSLQVWKIQKGSLHSFKVYDLAIMLCCKSWLDSWIVLNQSRQTDFTDFVSQDVEWDIYYIPVLMAYMLVAKSRNTKYKYINKICLAYWHFNFKSLEFQVGIENVRLEIRIATITAM